MNKKKLLAKDCRDAKELRRAFNQFLLFCFRNELLDELQDAADQLACKKLLKKPCKEC